MTATKHEGLYYRKNKRNKKVFIARFMIDGKSYKKKLGEEPHMNTHTANIARAELIGKLSTGSGSKSMENRIRTIDSLFEEFIESRKQSRSNSWYSNATKLYDTHLKDGIGSMMAVEIEPMHIQKIINDMLSGNNKRDYKYKPSTVKQIKDYMSGFFMFIKKKGIEVPNMGDELIVPKFDNKRYFSISDEDVQKLFNVIFSYENEKWRSYFIWMLHGRRKMEVAQMRWEYIDFTHKSYRVPDENNKASREIVAPLTVLLEDALVKYGVKSSGFIFDGDSDGHVSGGGIDYRWRDIRSLAGLHKMKLHDIRHLVGFTGVNSGYSLEMIGEVLGHSSTATTKRYSNMRSSIANDVLANMFTKYMK